MCHGPTDERASVGFTVVNGGLTAGMSTSVFLTADAVGARTLYAHIRAGAATRSF